MTLPNVDTLKAPAQRTARHLMVAVSALTLTGFAGAASAQTSTTVSASAQQTATQAPVTNETPAVTDDKYKPRVYGGAPAVTAPAQLPTSNATQPGTNPAPAQQQANIVTSDTVEAGTKSASIPTTSVEVNPDLPANAELNSSPNWPNAIRAQFIDVIVGAPIIKDPTTCSDGNPELRIKVSNVKNSKGIIVADLHDDVKENFLDWEKVVLRVRATATEDETFFCMPVPTAGTYAVAIYHDKNSNAFFDKNFLGLPKERFGMSNNPKFSTKSPEFEEAIFEVPAEGVDMEIKLRRTSDVISGSQD